MGVAQWGDVPAVISVGVVWLRLGCVAIGVWGMSGLGERETRVKRRQRRQQRRNLARQYPRVRNDATPPSNNPAHNPTPQPRGISRKPCPCLVHGYEAG